MPPTRRSETRKQNTQSEVGSHRATRSSRTPYTSPLNTKLPATRSRQGTTLAGIPNTSTNKRRGGKVDTVPLKKSKREAASEPKVAPAKNQSTKESHGNKEGTAKCEESLLVNYSVNDEADEESVADDEETSGNSSSSETSGTKHMEDEESNDESNDVMISDVTRQDTESEESGDDAVNDMQASNKQAAINECKTADNQDVMCVVGASFSLACPEQPILKDPEIAEVCSRLMEKGNEEEEKKTVENYTEQPLEMVQADSTTPSHALLKPSDAQLPEQARLLATSEKTLLENPHATLTPVFNEKTYVVGENCVCWQCGEVCTGSVGLQTHLVTHTYSLVYCCQQCGEPFPELFALGKHLLTHLEDSPLPCAHCQKQFAKPMHLLAHQKQQHGSCPSVISTSPHLEQVALTKTLASLSKHVRQNIVQSSPYLSRSPRRSNVTVTYTRAKTGSLLSVGHPQDNSPSTSVSASAGYTISHTSTEEQTTSVANSSLPAVCSLHAAQAASAGHIDTATAMRIKQEAMELDGEAGEAPPLAISTENVLHSTPLTDPAFKTIPAPEVGATMEDSLQPSEATPAVSIPGCIPYGNVQGAFLRNGRRSASKPTQSVTRCTYYYKQIRLLSEEMSTFSGGKKQNRYPCLKCAKAFSRFDELTNHITQHDKFEPFRCYKCAETFLRIGNFKKHLLHHQAYDHLRKITAPTATDSVSENVQLVGTAMQTPIPASSCTAVGLITPHIVTVPIQPGQQSVGGVPGSIIVHQGLIQSAPVKQTARTKPSILLSQTTSTASQAHTVTIPAALTQTSKPELIVLDDDEEKTHPQKTNAENSAVTVLPHGGTLILNPVNPPPQIATLPPPSSDPQPLPPVQHQRPELTMPQPPAPNPPANPSNIFLCAQCGQGFLTKLDLDRHSLTHALDSPYKCNICGQGFFQGYLLQKHLKYVHGPNSIQVATSNHKEPCTATVEATEPHQTPVLKVSNPSNTAATQVYTCEKCSNTFTLADLPPSFLLAHNYEVPKKCPDCQRGVPRHQLAANNGVSLQNEDQICCCPTCGKLFNNQRNLTTHMFCHKYSYLYS